MSMREGWSKVGGMVDLPYIQTFRTPDGEEMIVLRKSDFRKLIEMALGENDPLVVKVILAALAED